jgi:hypothetical protein
MARGRLAFKQTDVTRAIKAALAAGVQIARIEIDRGGRIVIVPGSPTLAAEPEYNEWDEVLK